MAPGSAARQEAVVQLLLLCGLPATAGFLEVATRGTLQTVHLNDNVTIFCKASGFSKLDSRFIGIRWYRKDHVSKEENKVFESFGDKKNAARTGAEVSPEGLQWGDASLQLPGVQLRDAGEYRCEVVVPPQKAEGRVLLEVLANPTNRVFLEQTKGRGKEVHLVCQSIGFYPEVINITWEKQTQKFPLYQRISTDVYTGPIIKNEKGIFNITSYLKLNASLEDNGTTYSCVVWHKSLYTYERLNYTWQVELPVREAENVGHFRSIFPPILQILIVVFLYCVLIRCHLCKPPLNNDFEEGSEMDTGSSGVMVSIADELVRNTGN
ncbi:natural cytotoxicity triggering receptor 3 ligand 1 [Cavia porcellus]|uniref:natural cytotoxicity triggering receptor 3 ligand 1 n=1 Tax=Cavia porcellus TaxID=10141 RepID=UPI002FDF5836